MARYFTRAEADAKVGTRVRVRRVWGPIPQGTKGRVVGTASLAMIEETPHFTAWYYLFIQWQPRWVRQSGRLPDWFSKVSYERWIEERGWSVVMRWVTECLRLAP